MYEEFFGLKEAPFSIAPNPLYLYMSRQHHEALAHLIYGVGRGGGFVLLTGEVGTGKTTICRCFLQQVPADTDVAFILNPKLNAEQLLATICDELDISYISDEITIKELVDSINHYLLQSHARGRHTVLIIDEAQNLSADVLEQLRLLTNLETNEKKLLQIVLLGQPELQEMFHRAELRQLAQRITARFHLRELQPNEVGPYVRHRLGVAGGRDLLGIFPERTLKRLYEVSSGIPRLINVICDRALLGAYAHNRRVVDVSILEAAAREVLGDSRSTTAARKRTLQIIVVSALAAAGVVSASMLWTISGAAPALPAVGAEHSRPDTAGPDTPGPDAPGPDTPGPDAPDAGTPPGSPVVESASENLTSTPDVPASLGGVTDTPVVPATGPVPDEESAALIDPQRLHTDPLHALAELAALQSVSFVAKESVRASCDHLRAQRVGCFERSAGLGYVVGIGLPVMVVIEAPSSAPAYAVLTRVDEATVELHANGESRSVSIGEFSLRWKGRFTTFWNLPKDYAGVLLPDNRSPLVTWVRESLARLGDADAGTGSREQRYAPDLVDAVKRFQRSRGETDDGILGETTVFRIVRELERHALAQEDAG